MHARHLVLLLLVFCAGCWDLKEIDTLAIVSMSGVDKDPETGDYTAYYQVINPMGLATGNGASAKAAVYTFSFKDFSVGRFSEKTGRAMPRRFFTAHMQSYIITERYARQGILDIVNFVELNPERRSNVILFVTDSPLYSVLNSYTPLDIVPGRFVRSLTNQYKPNFQMSRYPNRFKDIADHLNLHTPIIIPIVHYNGQKPASTTARLESIDATTDGLLFEEAAVFVHARMVGKLNERSKNLFFVLNNQYRKRTETLTVNGEYVDVEARNIKVKRKWLARGSRMSIILRADLRLLSNEQRSRMTGQNLQLIAETFSRKLERQIREFDRMGKDKGWDLTGIQDFGGSERNWRQTEVSVSVQAKVTTTGNTSNPYLAE